MPPKTPANPGAKRRRAAAGELRLLRQNRIVVDAKTFAAIQAMIAAPPVVNEKLRRLLRTKPPWEETGD